MCPRPPPERNADYARYMKSVSQCVDRKCELEPVKLLLWVGLEVVIWIPRCGLSHFFIASKWTVSGGGSWAKAGYCQPLPEHSCPLLQGKDVQKDLSWHGLLLSHKQMSNRCPGRAET